MFLKCRYTFSLYPVVICLSPLFSVVLALCLSVSLPGVVHVKLTRPDKDNSLTQSVVCFSPLFFALFHSIPQSSLIHPAVQLHYMVFSFRRLPSICFTPSVFLLWREMYSTQLSVYCVVWSFCHSCLPSSISPSIWLSGSLSIVIRLWADQSVFLCICVSLLLSPLLVNPFSPASIPPHLCQYLISFIPSFSVFHLILPSSIMIHSSCILLAFPDMSFIVKHKHIFFLRSYLIYVASTCHPTQKKQNSTTEIKRLYKCQQTSQTW